MITHKDSDGVSLLLAAIATAATYDDMAKIKSLVDAGMHWANAQTSEAERAAWQCVSTAAGWSGRMDPESV